MDLKNILILIVDDNFEEEDPLIFELQETFKDGIVLVPDEALKFISESLSQPIIVLLDISMPHHLDGHRTLEEIRKMSFNIPVVLFSAIDEKEETFSDFINRRVVGFIRKSESSSNIIERLKQIAGNFDFQFDYAIENWLERQPEEMKTKPFLKTSEGEVLSYSDMLKEIRMDSEIGKKMLLKLRNLSIDLFSENQK